jgi:hypothetical protein
MATASAGGPVREVLPAGGAAAGEHQAGAGEDGADKQKGAGEDHPFYGLCLRSCPVFPI